MYLEVCLGIEHKTYRESINSPCNTIQAMHLLQELEEDWNDDPGSWFTDVWKALHGGPEPVSETGEVDPVVLPLFRILQPKSVEQLRQPIRIRQTTVVVASLVTYFVL